ncbi:hypothetical protein D3C73_1053530 [compost metagenome]
MRPSAAGHWRSRRRSLPPVRAGSGQRPVPPDRHDEYCPPTGRAWCPGNGPCRNRDRTAHPWPESAAPRPTSARCAPASANRTTPATPESAAWRGRSRACLRGSPAARFLHRRCKHRHRLALPYRKPGRCRRHWCPDNRHLGRCSTPHAAWPQHRDIPSEHRCSRKWPRRRDRQWPCLRSAGRGRLPSTCGRRKCRSRLRRRCIRCTFAKLRSHVPCAI